MLISQMFKRKPCVFSIECFPPKQTANFEKMKQTLRTMSELHPDFISVTYGAGGSAGGVSTVEVAQYLKQDIGIEPLAHMICMGSDRSKAAELLRQLEAAGVRNVLTLRGDRTPSRPESPDFAHASDLAAFVWKTQPEFDIHAACYPEGHPEAANLREDVANLRFKQEAGASHLLTQLFFDNGHFYRFLNLARREGITLPVSAGVMPIVKRSQIERTVALSSASLPSEFTRMISRYQDDPQSLYAAGIDYAVQQLRDLIEGGADGVHLYAMNDAAVAKAVYEGISDLL
ncbi:MAG: methylenetetrahydrofolate reductase [Gemmiger sp.]|uniref:methylenetetrahydrofolate reductase n=1 Tax=Gemmiger sp. TaxID=2049027 RepID=UPI002E76CCBB|nr:methylenetetrahydrofolate reductase [Gemmiger sp.]MEE0801914.1 methylenetetrahydrofolate reductase [Gemmiger sp.]